MADSSTIFDTGNDIRPINARATDMSAAGPPVEHWDHFNLLSLGESRRYLCLGVLS